MVLSDSRNSVSDKILWLAVVIQTVVLLPLVAWYVFNGSELSRSLLLGGLAFYLPYCWQAWFLWLTKKMQASVDKKVTRLLRGEIQKWLMTAVIFALVFSRVTSLSGPAFFLAFIVMTLTGWLLPAALMLLQNDDSE